MGIVFEEDFDVGVVELVGGQDAEFVVDLEEDNRGHESAREVPGSLLGESEIVGHLRAPSWSGPIPAGWLRQCAAAGAITAAAQPSGRSLLADPMRVDRGRSAAAPNDLYQYPFAPRAPLQFAPPPPPPPPPPVHSQSTPSTGQPSIRPPPESPTRTLDEFVDHFLTSGHEASDPPIRLHPDPIPSDISDFDHLKLLLSKRAYSDVALLTQRLLIGPNSHYAPIWHGLLHGESSSLALESQQQEVLHIALSHLQALVKLKRYAELKQEVQTWTFAHGVMSGGHQRDDCPTWVPWSFHICVASCQQYTMEDANNDSNEPLDVLYSIRTNIPPDESLSLLRLDQAICNISARRKDWRMALVSLQNMLRNIPSACQQQCSVTGGDAKRLELACTCELLWRQGRVLLQAGATTEASKIFQKAASLWASKSADVVHPRPTLVLANMSMNDGLTAFASSQHDHALESFRKAAQLLKSSCQESSPAAEFLMDGDVLVTESPFDLYSSCVNNMALCAIYTVSGEDGRTRCARRRTHLSWFLARFANYDSAACTKRFISWSPWCERIPQCS